MTREALSASVDALRAAGVEDPRLDAELLLAEATGWERARLAAESRRRRFRPPPRAASPRWCAAGCGGSRSPTSSAGAAFAISSSPSIPRVLIPRPETELLVELALELRPRSVLDVGTGSGAIALAIAAELPDCEVTATDTSAGALAVAARQRRAARPGDAGRVLRGDPATGSEEFDLVVANLPYVSEREWGDLQREVTEWEPREALLAGPDGLDAFRAVVPALAAVTGHPGPGGRRGAGGRGGGAPARGRLRGDRVAARSGRDRAPRDRPQGAMA